LCILADALISSPNAPDRSSCMTSDLRHTRLQVVGSGSAIHCGIFRIQSKMMRSDFDEWRPSRVASSGGTGEMHFDNFIILLNRRKRGEHSWHLDTATYWICTCLTADSTCCVALYGLRRWMFVASSNSGKCLETTI
jgi:hypothetical protein